MTIQCVSSAIVCVAKVVAQTEERATIAPTDRSMPPPMITNVMPMLTTPTIEASRRIVTIVSTLAKRSPAVMTPTAQMTSSATTRPMLRPNEPLISPAPRDVRSDSAAASSTRTVSLAGATVFSTPVRSGPRWVPGVVLWSLMRRFLP